MTAEPSPRMGISKGARSASPDLEQGSHARSLLGPGAAALSLGFLIAAAIAANLWWLDSYRRGLPYSIDEAGYLQRGVAFAQQIASHGIPGFVDLWRRPDIVAPLLPAVSGVVRAVFGVGTFGMLATQQLFYGLTIVASYLLARRFAGRGWSLVTAGAVACVPGVIDAGRVFLLAEPCAALFCLVLVAQSYAAEFEHLPSSLLWGLTVGVAALTRTMVLGILVGPLLVTGLRLLASSPRRRQIANAGAGFAVAVVIAASWYWTSWATVFNYLTRYGYGSEASQYGHGNSLVSWGWWTTRLVDIVNQDVYLPLLVVLVSALVFLVAVAFLGSSRVDSWRRTKERGAVESSAAGQAERSIWAAAPMLRRTAASARSILRSDWGAVTLSIFVAWIVLSSTQNSGSYFELPLVVPLVVLLLAPIGNSRPLARVAMSALLIVGGSMTVADQLNWLPGASHYSSVAFGPLHVTAFNDAEIDFAGPKLRGSQLGGVFWTDCGGATITCFYGRSTGITLSYIGAWQHLNSEIASYVYRYASQHGYKPVVFFAYQGPLLNTNSVALEAQLTGKTLPIGALRQPTRNRPVSLIHQLDNPIYGQPNLVIAGEPSLAQANASPGSPPAALRRVQRLLSSDGFRLVRTLTLPDAAPVGVWWKDR